jgi:hypothetical protein
MNIPLTFDAEHQSAVDGLRAKYNADTNQNLTEPQYHAAVLLGIYDGEVKSLFDQAVLSIGAAAASLPYADRQALIEQIQSQLS